VRDLTKGSGLELYLLLCPRASFLVDSPKLKLCLFVMEDKGSGLEMYCLLYLDADNGSGLEEYCLGLLLCCGCLLYLLDD